MTMGGHTVDDTLVRGRSLAHAREATDDGEGVQQGEPMFELVTEARQRGNHYSACADLGHHTLMRLLEEFVPDATPAQLAEAFRTINRDEAAGWKVGMNVARLYASPAFVKQPKGTSILGKPGDIGLIGENGAEHIFVLESLPDHIPGEMTSFDYGQVFQRTPKEPAKFGGKRRVRRLSLAPDGRLHADARPVVGWLDPADWVARVRAAG